MDHVAIISTKAMLKNVSYGVAFLIGAVGLSTQAFAIFGVLIIGDTITGVIRSLKLRGGRSVTSLKLTSGVISKLLIITVPLIIAWAGKGAGINLHALAQGALSMLILAEAYSVLGNIHAIRVGKDLKEFDAITYILEKVRGIIETYLKDAGGRKPD